MYQWAAKNAGYILIAILAIAFLSADGLHVINYPPKSIHQWRQSDCLAYAKTYYQDGNGFFSPATYNLAGTEGRVASEIPIIYYLAGQFFKLFGVHYFILRGLTFLCCLLGFYYLYKCINLWMRPSPVTVFPIIMLATAPFYYYYAINYLPNVPGMSFSFAGLYYFLLFETGSKRSHLLWGTFYFTLAILLKPTDGGLVWVSFLGVMFVRFLQRKLNARVAMGLAASTGFILACMYGWYKYVEWYNNVNGNHQNLQGLYPMWEMIQKDIEYVWNERIHDFWAASYQQRIILHFLIPLVAIYLVRLPVLNSFLRLFTFFTFIGTLAYDVLWFKAFSDHDYYQLVNVIPCIFLIITVLEWYVNRIEMKYNVLLRTGVAAILLLLVAIGIYHNRNIQHERYTKADFIYKDPEIYDAEPFLRKLGIQHTDAIVSVPDPSPNITLAAYGTRGYTESFNNDHFNIRFFRTIGANYLIINDSSYLHNPMYEPFTHKLLGKFGKSIYVFDIR